MKRTSKVIGRVQLYVPSEILKILGFGPGDQGIWEIQERGGEKIAILRRKPA